MATIHDLIDPIELSNFVTAELTEYEQSLDQTLAGFIPLQQIGGIDYEFSTQPTNSYVAAKYRAWDAEPVPLGRETLMTLLKGELPPMSVRSMLSENDQMTRVRIDGTDSDFVDFIYEDAAFQARAIADRFELQRGEAIATDQVEIDENSLKLPGIGFGRPAGNAFVAAIPWSNPAADILGDLTTWLSDYRRNNSGRSPAGIIISDEIWMQMLRNNAIRDIVLGPTAGVTNSPVNGTQLDAVLTEWRIPPMIAFDRQVTVTDDDTTNATPTRVLPEGSLYFMPGDQVGSVLLGQPVLAARGIGLQATDATGIISATWHEPHTEKLWTKSTAVGLTVLGRSANVYSAQVL